MATTTKKTSKKTAAAKTTTKKPVAAKKSTTKKKTPEMQSFRPCADATPFMTFRITKQTLYWLILSVFILGLGLWVVKLQSDILYLYDQIDQSMQASDELTLQLQEKQQAKEQQQQ